MFCHKHPFILDRNTLLNVRRSLKQDLWGEKAILFF